MASTLNIVGFAPDHLSLRLSLLVIEPGLLSVNPAEASDHRQPNSVVIEP
jgi:hypothetical protein